MRRWLALVAIMLSGIALLFQQGYLVETIPSSTIDAKIFADVSHTAGIVNNRVISLDMAIGQAWGDYDNDGWVDLYVTDPAGKNSLYHNEGDGTFSVSILESQVALPNAYSAGATFVDYDNDGWKDLFVANWGIDNLFHNEGGSGFVDVTHHAGIIDEGNSKTASWGDFDNDGFLDLYIANWSCYPKCGRPMDGDTDHLYHNNGDGTFDNVTDYLGGGVNGAGFVASFTDFDNDGDPDIYLVNDEFINPVGNKLWRNDGPGCNGWCFKQVAVEAGANSTLFGMGLAVGDYNNDGNMDFYFSNVGPMELLRNRGDGTFEDVAQEAGVQSRESIGWGAVFIDYNNDGWRDLYLAVADTTTHKGIAANKLFKNNADGTFTLVSCSNDSSDVRPSLGVAYADYNHDGWVDLVVGNMDEGYRLYQNQTGLSEDNHWLAIELVGGGNVNRDAVGARVYVTMPDGVSQMQDLINGSSLGAGNEAALYFGVGKSRKAEVRIRWPDGTEQSFKNIKADQRYRLQYSTTEFEVLEKTTITREKPKIEWNFEKLFAWIPRSKDSQIRSLMSQADVTAPTRLPVASPQIIELGNALFWDPELSGNRDVACATCHHSNTGTGDNLSLSIGVGGFGLGVDRVRVEERRDLVPRNAQPIFNLGYTDWTVFFWDGRVSLGPDGWFNSPASDRLPSGLDNLLAAQAMFPVTSRDEMRGLRGDVDINGQPNELAVLVDYAARPIWSAITKRLLAIPEYVNLFKEAYPEIPPDELGFQHAANAIAAYESETFTFDDTPFDNYLHGNNDALTQQQKDGALLFFGKADCASCHSGPLLSDQKFYNIAVPQIGDGKGREQPFDYGRARETGNECDRYAFRTPPLRNVALSGPWMHNGAFNTLEAVIRHHLNPAESLQKYDPSQLSVLLQDTCQDQPEVIAEILASKSNFATQEATLTDKEIQDLLAFLDAFTSPSGINLENTIPSSVPSGLPVGGNLQNINDN